MTNRLLTRKRVPRCTNLGVQLFMNNLRESLNLLFSSFHTDSFSGLADLVSLISWSLGNSSSSEGISSPKLESGELEYLAVNMSRSSGFWFDCCISTAAASHVCLSLTINMAVTKKRIPPITSMPQLVNKLYWREK